MTLFPELKSKKKVIKKTTFSERVVKLALSVPKGKVTTYGALAKAAGGGGMASRSVTGILGKAWESGEKKIPFHRIIYSDGRIWVSNKYRRERMEQYKKEGITVDTNDKIVNFRDILVEW